MTSPPSPAPRHAQDLQTQNPSPNLNLTPPLPIHYFHMCGPSSCKFRRQISPAEVMRTLLEGSTTYLRCGVPSELLCWLDVLCRQTALRAFLTKRHGNLTLSSVPPGASPCVQSQKIGHVTFFWNGNRGGKFDKNLETYQEVGRIISQDQSASTLTRRNSLSQDVDERGRQ